MNKYEFHEYMSIVLNLAAPLNIWEEDGNCYSCTTVPSIWERQKQPFRGVLSKRCSENVQQICSRTPMPKCDLNKVALQLYWNHTLAWVFSCKFAAYFQNTFYKEHLWMAASRENWCKVEISINNFPRQMTIGDIRSLATWLVWISKERVYFFVIYGEKG